MAPRKVMLVRHAEKLGDPTDDQVGGPNLSIRGSARAAALPALFLGPATTTECAIDAAMGKAETAFVQGPLANPQGRFDTPDLIVATADSHGSCRPRQTASPTAMALGLPIDGTYTKSAADAIRLANDLLTSARFAGKIVLVFWHHGTMQQIAETLGVTNAAPWPTSTVFDRVWIIDFGRQPPAFDDEPQRLLYGDRDQ